ncbi:T6SS immunity phospholipase A1-binding lipoprotein Tli1-KP [Enterobacter asburiae]|uniref:T6SS immunity phospholipase A1-binding lipoprotein Tli1-KP n=1 Tax=Enterobacter asburiae TaxID=61645 RepID=UPI002FFCD334
MKHPFLSPLLAGLLLLTGCSQPAAQAGGGGGGTIKAINHTKWAINHFSVDNQSGIDIIGPFQGGGGGCCYSVPARWTPGMTVRIDWETGVGYSMDFPGYEDRKKYLAWKKSIDAQKRQHSKTVPVPDYNGQDVCGITVHFLPCDEVKVTTSCWSPRNANYPIKEPIRMKEPKVCPK